MAQPEGFEPPTIRLEGGCSIQLSYGCFNLVGLEGFEPIYLPVMSRGLIPDLSFRPILYTYYITETSAPVKPCFNSFLVFLTSVLYSLYSVWLL